jgi:hypothetical protein
MMDEGAFLSVDLVTEARITFSIREAISFGRWGHDDPFSFAMCLSLEAMRAKRGAKASFGSLESWSAGSVTSGKRVSNQGTLESLYERNEVCPF